MKSVSTIFYIVRHGETDGNVKRIQQGHMDFPLNENGVQQAKKRAQDLKKIHFDHAYSSDLIRAHKTAAIIALEHDLVVTTTQALRERNYGKFEGISTDDYTQEINTLFEKWHGLAESEWLQHRVNETVETGEEVVSRALLFLREIAVGHPGKTILTVCHGGVMRDLLVHLGWAKQSELRRYAIKNTGYFILETDGVDFFVKDTVGIEKKK